MAERRIPAGKGEEMTGRGRKPATSTDEIWKIYHLIQQNPGITPTRIGEKIGKGANFVRRNLERVERVCGLLSEGHDGALYVFDRR